MKTRYLFGPETHGSTSSRLSSK